ncbi:C-GCAxxG-C-C family (seleno)protein [Sporomusa sp. KB1]|jgi:C_GCAxxG_C_C family probable redox protein|uniref:C-GCAxxG-C-C family (seleno)protein n=1 Tax=Sporomusa sp. KB1 TaxID=943346 RepID=UPI0011ACC36C|nr:C-GCAxxG-C-C family (seleno)protein [Sporomusa sp. KB1]TWH51793.1 C_GCAxxG_C_C family probable redox protein [Sporomusa sp. KB1]
MTKQYSEELKMENVRHVVDKEYMKQAAGQNFRAGYNCAEAIVRAFRDAMQLDISDEALRMASGFGGGLGHAGCLCGALTGSIMVLGMLQGRENKEQSREPIYTSSHEFHNLFREKFGATCCRILNSHPFDSKEHLRNCIKITGNTAECLSDFIRDKRL